MSMRTRLLCVTLGLVLGTAAPAAAQGRGRGPKKYEVTNDRALVVTREVLVRHGYEGPGVRDLEIGTAAPAAAQGRGRGPKKYEVTNDRALVVTREVLVRHGYEGPVVRDL